MIRACSTVTHQRYAQAKVSAGLCVSTSCNLAVLTPSPCRVEHFRSWLDRCGNAASSTRSRPRMVTEVCPLPSRRSLCTESLCLVQSSGSLGLVMARAATRTRSPPITNSLALTLTHGVNVRLLAGKVQRIHVTVSRAYGRSCGVDIAWVRVHKAHNTSRCGTRR